MMKGEKILEIRHLSKMFGKNPVLRDISNMCRHNQIPFVLKFIYLPFRSFFKTARAPSFSTSP